MSGSAIMVGPAAGAALAPGLWTASLVLFAFGVLELGAEDSDFEHPAKRTPTTIVKRSFLMTERDHRHFTVTPRDISEMELCRNGAGRRAERLREHSRVAARKVIGLPGPTLRTPLRERDRAVRLFEKTVGWLDPHALATNLA